MVSSSYYNNYGSYGSYGYPQQSGSMLGGDTSMSSAYSTIPATSDLNTANIHNLTQGITATYNQAMNPQSQGGGGGGLFGGIGNFFKGIVNGATNMVKSLADPKTWLMIGAAGALCFFFPPAGFALLAVGGVMAGSQILKGVTSGNMEQAGEGVFNLGMVAAGGAGMGGAIGDASIAGTRAAETAAATTEATTAADSAVLSAGRLEASVAEGQTATGTASTESSIAAGEKAASTAENAASMLPKENPAAAEATSEISTTNAKLQAASEKLNGAMEAQARAEVQGLDKAGRQNAISGGPKPETVDQAKGQVNDALTDLSMKKNRLGGMKETDPGYADARSAVDRAEKNARAKLETYRQLQYQKALADQATAVEKMGGARRWYENTKQATRDNIAVLRGNRMTRPDGTSRTLYNSTFKTPEELSAGKAAEAENSGGFFSGVKDKVTGLKDRVFGSENKTAPAAEPAPATPEAAAKPTATTAPEAEAATTTPPQDTFVDTKLKEWEAATPQQRTTMEQDPQLTSELKSRGFKITQTKNSVAFTDNNGVGIFRRNDGITGIRRPDGTFTIRDANGQVLREGGPKGNVFYQAGPRPQNPQSAPQEMGASEQPATETGSTATVPEGATAQATEANAGWFGGMKDKMSGYLKPGTETNGFAGYKNYLLSHKLQSWTQAQTALNPLLGGQPGQQGQGGGLLNFGGLLG